MNDGEPKLQATDLVLEYELDASPQTVWRAISIPDFRESWLPTTDLANAEPVSSSQNGEISYRMKDNEPPFLESIVTFQVKSDTNGGTILKIIHELEDARSEQQLHEASNNNTPCLMRAA